VIYFGIRVPDGRRRGWKMSKYEALRRYLEGQPGTTPSVTVTFRQIERILGFPLPNSARSYQAWWANDTTHSHAVWLEAGWKTREVDMASERVTFVRAGHTVSAGPAAAATPGTGASRPQVTAERARRRIGLIGCTKAKLNRPAPARELYSASDLFRKAAAYCDRYLDGWFVLSAKYGLVEPERVIEPYDVTLNTMSRSECRRWGMQVAQQLRQVGDVALEAHAGANYVRPLVDAGVVLDEPLRGLAIGQRKRWYMDRLR